MRERASPRLAFPASPHYNFVTGGGMFMTLLKAGFATVVASMLAASVVGTSSAHAQSVPYWTSTTGFGSALTSDPNASRDAFGNFSSRYNFENGWFIGSERGNLGFGPSSFSPISAFGSPSSFSYEGTQAGYNF